mmetsp:Transcript_36262/g.108397  ORF Transcript_36262/g.108397 Transcript_36262/m.108397 type:complete len:221 (-) Transcript_36262:84-746(-)
MVRHRRERRDHGRWRGSLLQQRLAQAPAGGPTQKRPRNDHVAQHDRRNARVAEGILLAQHSASKRPKDETYLLEGVEEGDACLCRRGITRGDCALHGPQGRDEHEGLAAAQKDKDGKLVPALDVHQVLAAAQVRDRLGGKRTCRPQEQECSRAGESAEEHRGAVADAVAGAAREEAHHRVGAARRGQVHADDRLIQAQLVRGVHRVEARIHNAPDHGALQ